MHIPQTNLLRKKNSNISNDLVFVENVQFSFFKEN